MIAFMVLGGIISVIVIWIVTIRALRIWADNGYFTVKRYYRDVSQSKEDTEKYDTIYDLVTVLLDDDEDCENWYTRTYESNNISYQKFELKAFKKKEIGTSIIVRETFSGSYIPWCIADIFLGDQKLTYLPWEYKRELYRKMFNYIKRKAQVELNRKKQYDVNAMDEVLKQGPFPLLRESKIGKFLEEEKCHG